MVMYIKTERLVLQPIGVADLADLVELLTDDIVKKTYLLPDFSHPVILLLLKLSSK